MSFQSVQWAVSAEKDPFWQKHCAQNRKRWSAFVISAKIFLLLILDMAHPDPFLLQVQPILKGFTNFLKKTTGL